MWPGSSSVSSGNLVKKSFYNSGDTTFLLGDCIFIFVYAVVSWNISIDEFSEQQTRSLKLHCASDYGDNRYRIIPTAKDRCRRASITSVLANVWVWLCISKVIRVAAFGCEGLCGLYNLDKSDDLRQRNGDVYTGEGSDHGKQPKPFTHSWRSFTDSLNISQVASEV